MIHLPRKAAEEIGACFACFQICGARGNPRLLRHAELHFSGGGRLDIGTFREHNGRLCGLTGREGLDAKIEKLKNEYAV
jgi:hypothetical protein